MNFMNFTLKNLCNFFNWIFRRLYGIFFENFKYRYFEFKKQSFIWFWFASLHCFFSTKSKFHEIWMFVVFRRLNTQYWCIFHCYSLQSIVKSKYRSIRIDKKKKKIRNLKMSYILKIIFYKVNSIFATMTIVATITIITIA